MEEFVLIPLSIYEKPINQYNYKSEQSTARVDDAALSLEENPLKTVSNSAKLIEKKFRHGVVLQTIQLQQLGCRTWQTPLKVEGCL